MRMGEKVLDVSQFKHPGGNDKIDSRAGEDVLDDFLAMKHSSKADLIARDMVIGKFQQSDTPLTSNLLSVNMAFGPSSTSSMFGPGPKESEAQTQEEIKIQQPEEKTADEEQKDESTKVIDGVRYVS